MRVRCQVEPGDTITFADKFDEGIGPREPELEVTMTTGSGHTKCDVYLSPYAVALTIEHLTAALNEWKGRENESEKE